jgi:hypothetical protein
MILSKRFLFSCILFLSLGLGVCRAADPDLGIDFYRDKANNDTVAKILNYTEGLDESGSDNAFWYPFNASACIYRKAALIESNVEIPSEKESANANNSQDKKIYRTEIVFDPVVREINLNTWTPSTVKVGYVQHAGTWWGPNNYYIHVLANGIPMMESSKPRDIERTQAAWNLVFNRFCPGRKNNF